MSDPNRLPPGEFNMPPGVSSRDIPGNQRETCPSCGKECDFDQEECANCGYPFHEDPDNLM